MADSRGQRAEGRARVRPARLSFRRDARLSAPPSHNPDPDARQGEREGGEGGGLGDRNDRHIICAEAQPGIGRGGSLECHKIRIDIGSPKHRLKLSYSDSPGLVSSHIILNFSRLITR